MPVVYKTPTVQSISGTVSVSNLPPTQPVSASALPLPSGASTSALQIATSAILSSLDTTLQALLARYTSSQSTISASAVVTTTSVKILAANPNRKGLFLYNNSANSGYVALGSPANSASNMTVLVATFATWAMPQPIYTGDIYAIRNAGTGTFLATELT